MACTTILVGKKASYDGSTMIARNDDSQSGSFTPKKMEILKSQNKIYESKISKVKIPLPDYFYQTTYVPNALDNEGVWGASGINVYEVAMTATETITTNPRVLAYDPLVTQGIGEEDIVSLVLPYIQSAKEGVLRLGKLLETYGTYESNGIAFSDSDEIWWLETVGGHHWYAKRIDDYEVVIMPNQLGLDKLDFEDHENYLYSHDLYDFVCQYHLNLNVDDTFNPRLAFGSSTDSDHTYNTPRRWILLKYFNKKLTNIHPEDDDLPFSLIPDRKITIEDVKEALSNHYQSTDFDVYGKYATKKGLYRPIGINRNDFVSCMQIKKGQPSRLWISFASNVFNGFTAFFTHVDTLPEYLTNTTENVNTNNFYWMNRLIAALADSHYQECMIHIERYQLKVAAKTHHLLEETDDLEETNFKIAQMVEEETQNLLNKVLFESSLKMKNAFSRSDG